MRKGPIVAVAVIALTAGALLPRAFAPSPAATAAETQSPAPAPGVPVTPGVVALADVPIVLHAIGTVQAYNMVTIKSRVDGQIVGVEFTEGEIVKAGTKLYQIDPRPFQAALDQAEAIKQKNEAQLASAQADLARAAGLVDRGFTSRQTYDQTKALVAQLQAAVRADEAQINTARLNLGYATIRSPIDGRLGARLVDVGNMVRAADSIALVTVAQLQPIFASFTLPQENIDPIRERHAEAPLEVQVFAADARQRLATGKLTLIDNAVDQTTGTIRLKATFANDDERLWPGAFVNVRVVLGVRNGVPTVPAQTVQQGPTGRFAYVIKEDNTVERRAVEIVAVQDGVAVIGKGLAAGETVVVEGQHRLSQGARVRPNPPKPEAAG